MDIDRDLLHRYLLGDSSEEENVQIVRWVDEDPKHYDELKALGIIYDAKIWFQDKNVHTEKAAPISSSNRFKHIIIEICKIAAVFVIGFLLNNIVQQFTPAAKSKMLSFYAPVGQRAELTLDDGTHVWLNANSRIIYPAQFDAKQRNVTLQGEAYFKVTHNAKRPFIVNAEGYRIKVLGTEFNVQAYSKSRFETDLLHGSVHIITPNNQIAKLKPGTRIYMKDNQTVKGCISHPEHFEWRDGLISFKEESLDDIFKKIELYYDVSITTNNKELLNTHFSGKFRVRDGVEHIMKVLQIANHFIYKINDNRNKITIE
jgi:ferric-dicitrate binding protein FerR (iron transport regulator)